MIPTRFRFVAACAVFALVQGVLVGWVESSEPTLPAIAEVGSEDSAHPTALQDEEKKRGGPESRP